jgi:hypothetical protein
MISRALYVAHGVTDRRRAHAELQGRGQERPVASNTNDRQMAHKIPVHFIYYCCA